MSEIQVVMSGIGQSEVGRRVERSALAMTIDAILEALDDAGLAVSDIDGLTNFPGAKPSAGGFAPIGNWAVIQALRLQLRWFTGGTEGSGQLGAFINAYAAIKAGLANHVIVFRTVKEGSGGVMYKTVTKATERVRVADEYQWLYPFNAPSAVTHNALLAQRYMDMYGITREQLAQIALVSRHNAGLNPKAVYRAPMTMDDYMAARMISTPLCLFDCDAPTDASTVVILSNAEAAKDLKSKPIRIEAIQGGLQGPSTAWDQFEVKELPCYGSARGLWSQTDLKPADVDIGLLYDGFSFMTLNWLEAFGFCKIGESGAFVEGGQRISLDGELPINPHGGQLSGGRIHGFGFVHEAVTQLRGLGGARQVKKDLQVAAVGVGGGLMVGSMLLVKD